MKVSYQSIVIKRFSEEKISPTKVLVLLTVHSEGSSGRDSIEDSKDYFLRGIYCIMSLFFSVCMVTLVTSLQ